MKGSQKILQLPSSVTSKAIVFFAISALGVVLAGCETGPGETTSTDTSATVETAAPPPPPPDNFTRLQVFFATDRAQETGTANRVTYGGARGDGSLRFGVAEVSIPNDHRMGHLERPSLWRLEFREDPERHIVVLTATALDHDGFLSSLRETIAASNRMETLVFVHGYNVTFDEALRRTAQMSYDLNFQGPPVLYSWPSEGYTGSYFVDGNNVEWSARNFRTFLRLVLTEAGAQRVHVVAHSMGNRAVVAALRELDPSSLPEEAADLHHVVFAAPDIDADTFRIFAADFHGRADRYTLYASSNDLALKAAQRINGYPRAGDSGDGLVVVDGIDTVDASNVATGFLRHSYIGDNRSVISDLFYLIRHDTPPNERASLVERYLGDVRYWLFQP